MSAILLIDKYRASSTITADVRAVFFMRKNRNSYMTEKKAIELYYDSRNSVSCDHYDGARGGALTAACSGARTAGVLEEVCEHGYTMIKIMKRSKVCETCYTSACMRPVLNMKRSFDEGGVEKTTIVHTTTDTNILCTVSIAR